MTPLQIISLSIRLFAIWLAVYVLRTIPYFYSQSQKYSDGFAVGFGIGILLIVLLLLVLWFFPRTIAKGLLPTSTTSPQEATSPDIWFMLGCSLLGLWVLSDALPTLVKYFVYLYLDAKADERATFPPGWATGSVSYVLHLLIGFWLLFGARGIKNFVTWARHAGRD